MVISDKIVFVQLHKTAGTHIALVLDDLISTKKIGKHLALSSVKETGITSDRVILASVRNPWDWYVSLWAYGCQQQGSLHRNLTRGRKLGYRSRVFAMHGMTHTLRGLESSFLRPKSVWREVYSDSSEPRKFQRWLKMLLSPQRKYDSCEEYAESRVSKLVGFYTFRYLRLFSTDDKWLYAGPVIDNYTRLNELASKEVGVERFIKVENLEKDLLAALIYAGYDINSSHRKVIESREKTNTSSRNDYRSYYDRETFELVEDRERYIISTHGYG